MLGLRSSIAASIALLLLLGGPAQAARTLPTAGKNTRPQARRRAIRPAAKAPAHQPAGRPQSAPAPVSPRAGASAPPETRLLYLAGLVLGADGQPCPGVCVFPTTNVRQIAVTDAHGAFLLQVPAHTALSLQAEYVGLGSTRIALDGETAQPVHITLGR
ncbi:hypothetical protein GKZ68_03185 [Hymenobacter sp. BRD128]|uniref:hypothetical protein n=1 Tax=Hymenobacter sp. BRD128 TaxID=2675878 RepID=UPI0015669C85|nr:hypothetical protein [Hymenobacter sp. BRD128]QKG55732.1 hypothetical protein GKZ68_03185 [Hymenobacter sp. BRD128]